MDPGGNLMTVDSVELPQQPGGRWPSLVLWKNQIYELQEDIVDHAIYIQVPYVIPVGEW